MNEAARLERTLAWTGGALGMAAGLAFGALRAANSPPPVLRGEWFGDIAFALVYAAPFALALIALRGWTAALRAAVDLAAAALGVAALFSTFSGAGVIFLPAALLLLAAGAAALLAARSYRWLPLIVAPLLIAAGVGAGLVLLAGHADGRCWQLVRDTAGDETWQSAPYQNGGTVSASAGDSGPGVVSVTCTSDVISPLEAATSTGILAFTGGGLALLARPLDNPPTDTHGEN